MKKTFVIALSILVLASCKKEEKVIPMKSDITYASFGDTISVDKALSEDGILATYEKLSPGDTVAVKFQSKIKAVCKEKGCWMNLELPKGKEVFVKFKDYAFFVPTDSKNENVIISGKAFISVESVADLKHYAKDGGKSQAAIDSIVTPKTKYSLMADGVLIQK